MALNPPPGTALVVALVGVALIYWYTKPKAVRMSIPAIGILVCVIGVIGFGVWYLVGAQPEAQSAANATVYSETQVNDPFLKNR